MPELDQPAVSEYPVDDAHQAEVDRAKHFIDDALAGNGGEDWQAQGERDNVTLSRRLNPSDPYAVPTVKGTCLVEGATTDQLLPVIQLPGMRHLWDSRFESGHMLRRFAFRRFSFYSAMKGMGWLVYSRTVVGVQATLREEHPNSEVLVIQTSIVDDELAPAEDYKVRANLTAAGWLLKPVDGGVELTYCVSISLAGGIPATMTSMLATEIPTCCGRVRDVFYQHGSPPYISLVDPSKPSSTTFQTENYTHTSPDRQWRTTVTTSAGEDGHFAINYDTTRMYTAGVKVELSGPAAASSKAEDDGKGRIVVTSTVDKQRLDITISPK